MRRVLLLLCPIVLAACTSLAPTQPLPAYAGDADFFRERWAADPANRESQAWEDYRLWIVRFYEGSVLYRRGWIQTVDEVTEALAPATRRARVRDRLIELGRRISANWAKDNEHRVVDNRLLSLWGDALREGVARGEVVDLLDRVEADLDDLLAGRTVPEDIRRGRYFEVATDDPFLF